MTRRQSIDHSTLRRIRGRQGGTNKLVGTRPCSPPQLLLVSLNPRPTLYPGRAGVAGPSLRALQIEGKNATSVATENRRPDRAIHYRGGRAGIACFGDE